VDGFRLLHELDNIRSIQCFRGVENFVDRRRFDAAGDSEEIRGRLFLLFSVRGILRVVVEVARVFDLRKDRIERRRAFLGFRHLLERFLHCVLNFFLDSLVEDVTHRLHGLGDALAHECWRQVFVTLDLYLFAVLILNRGRHLLLQKCFREWSNHRQQGFLFFGVAIRRRLFNVIPLRGDSRFFLFWGKME